MRARIETWIRRLIREELAEHDRETATQIRLDLTTTGVSFTGGKPLDPIPFYRRFS